jgi:hypothetical protein
VIYSTNDANQVAPFVDPRGPIKTDLLTALMRIDRYVERSLSRFRIDFGRMCHPNLPIQPYFNRKTCDGVP